jgi:predicted small metal-binding protein
MDRVIRCRDVGFDCEGVIRAKSYAEAVAQAAAHTERAWPG